ncbi:Chloride channel core [Gluconacetobacter diazotrophicus PA1 5]|uniref:chloride channel protein n=1 Tax=Gluconacetobacter diazotrophicus TaxID=33996 RepID=UPI000173CFD3|nr:Chloride channel core [Gluconacetobacter diazotrophicus PA1 5]TWB09810.1 CIC family chloride channel protein [Gluconacetobacter diazotrophicus]
MGAARKWLVVSSSTLGLLTHLFRHRGASLSEGGPAKGLARDDRVSQVPRVLRALVRADEIWLVVLAACVGTGAGLLVSAMTHATLLAHRVLFAVGGDGRISGLPSIAPLRAILVPSLGGLVLGLLGVLIARYAPGRPVDPIEANALHGGRMSTLDSAIVALQTVLSNSVGASVGLEAGFTQIGAATGSRLGRMFRVRREDLRLLVGCGAAGAIGAAFNAPLAGAFYAFELVIGTYSLANLAPVAAASICAIGVTHLLHSAAPGVTVDLPAGLRMDDYLPIATLGIVAALLGVALMYCVTLAETLFRRSGLPAWMCPAVGGTIVGTMALVSPSVLSSGHWAMRVALEQGHPTGWILVLLALKAVASSVSIGSGFRGGLFFASLYLGVLTGAAFGGGLALVSANPLSAELCALVGMSAMAVAVVGGPMTMVFLALEMTGSLPLTVAVLVASVISGLTVRRTFGYSFATWRFHLRGESIRSAVDVGWIRTLTVGRMMRRDVKAMCQTTTVQEARHAYPLGAAQRFVLVDGAGRYVGLVQVPDLYAETARATEDLTRFAQYRDVMLMPQMNLRDAIARFEQAESDALVVVDGMESRMVLGLLTEQHALRRYSEELDRTRRELAGEGRLHARV